MVQFTDIPDGWHEFEYETGPERGNGPYTEELSATWASEDEQIMIHANQSVDADGRVTYPVAVEQHIRAESEDDVMYKTVIQSHAKIGEDRREAEKLAVAFMEEVNSGEHKLRTLGVQVPDNNDFIQFFTISDSELPGDLTANQVIDLINSEEYGNSIEDLPDEISRELAGEQMIQVDVFPRHKSEIQGVEDES